MPPGWNDVTVAAARTALSLPRRAAGHAVWQRMPNLEEVVWCQEEPRNNGAWFFVNR